MHFTNKCIRVDLPIPEDGQWLRNRDLQKVAFDSAVEGFFLTHYDFLAKLEDSTSLPGLRSVGFACRSRRLFL